MHTRRSAPLSSLSLVLPHPPLPRRTPSIHSQDNSDQSPRTPRNSFGQPSPTLFRLDSTGPRRSTDSWNSSNCDGGEDEVEWEWTKEQLKLLNKTLDALPSHLLTPFNGPVPPANVLDKISRSIIHAKDPIEWPHSIRSTRAKLLKLARGRDEENNRSSESSNDVLQSATNVPRKPLYRQSSMDFLKGNTLLHEKSMDRLSTRLQRTERVIPNPVDPYIRNPSHPSSPASGLIRAQSAIGDSRLSTSSIEGLSHRSSISSLSSGRAPRLRRSTTTLLNLPTIQAGIPSNCVTDSTKLHPHSLQKIKRSESFSSPSMNGFGHSLKRAPSFGTISTRSHDSRMSVDDQKENNPQEATKADLDIYPSSDDEEKARTKKVKKQKTSNTSADKTRRSTSTLPRATSTSTLKSGGTTPKGSVRSKKSTKQRARSSSIFGAELTQPQPEPILPELAVTVHTIPEDTVPATPGISPHRTLRRVKTTNFPSRMISRRISFSNLVAPVEEEVEHTGVGLGSAFQMQ